MSEETQVIQEEKHFHHHKNRFLKKFTVVALGTFVGGFCAISLFAALHKPPMMVPYHPMMMHHQKMMGDMGYRHRDCDCPCHKKMNKKPEKFNDRAQKHLDENKD